MRAFGGSQTAPNLPEGDFLGVWAPTPTKCALRYAVDNFRMSRHSGGMLLRSFPATAEKFSNRPRFRFFLHRRVFGLRLIVVFHRRVRAGPAGKHWKRRSR
jgi:hypothetical protein